MEVITMFQLRHQLLKSGVAQPFLDRKRAAHCSRLLARWQEGKGTIEEYLKVKRTLPKELAKRV